jgi:hypothetical protein
MNALAKFLFRLSTDPKKLRQFQKNPRAVIREAGLTRREREAVLSKSADRIRGALGLRCFGRGKTI